MSTHYVLAHQDGSLELFRGYFPNSFQGTYLYPDQDHSDKVALGPWKVLKVFRPGEALKLDAIVELLGWEKVRILFQFSKPSYELQGYIGA